MVLVLSGLTLGHEIYPDLTIYDKYVFFSFLFQNFQKISLIIYILSLLIKECAHEDYIFI
jgi:hypothetical protein